MALNTVRTTLGFLRSVVARHLPFLSATRSIDQIYNYLEIDTLFATSGQPTEEQFGLIRDAGYEVVINLAPTSALENSLSDEQDVLRELGLDYVHIPVDFQNPTEEDFARFSQSVEDSKDRRLWIHCAANMRVSAFVYRYRRSVLGEDEPSARADLDKIWNPFGVWKRFIGD